MKTPFLQLVLLFSLMILLFTQEAYSQEEEETEEIESVSKEPVNYRDFLEQLLISSDTLLVIRDKSVDFGNLRIEDINSLVKGTGTDTGRVFINKSIEFHNCEIRGRGVSDIVMKSILFRNCDMTSFRFSNVRVNHLRIIGGTAHRLKVIKSSFDQLQFSNLSNKGRETGIISLFDVEVSNELLLSNNRLYEELSINSSELANLSLKNNETKLTTLANNKVTREVLIHDEKANEFMFRKNILTSVDSLRNTIGINCDRLVMIDNQFEVPVLFADSEVSLRVEMANNRFAKPADFHDVSFPEFGKYVPFSQFEAGFVVYQNLYDEDSPDGANCYYCELYTGNSDEELADKTNFDKLVQSYEIMFLGYKSTGDIESANMSYIRIKDLYLSRLGYLYHTNGGFKHYFRWKLAQLLKFYTNHGTDPALSIVISIYVILIFAIFYIFYPSEWDVTSKTRLIADFREFIDKNDKGRMKPFFTLAAGLAISLFNAITLSINSFVTLGFGTIPTSGAARYVCILQGFIGWFLLSIFTVSLINQILF